MKFRKKKKKLKLKLPGILFKLIFKSKLECEFNVFPEREIVVYYKSLLKINIQRI